MLNRAHGWLFDQPKNWLGLLLLGMLALLATGLVLEHGFGVLPCEMCWWQRYAHMTVAGFAALGLLAPGLTRAAAAGMALAALAGLGTAIWQFAAQHGWLPFPEQCAGGVVELSSPERLLQSLRTLHIVPCDQESFSLLGLSLAGWNIPAMLGTLYITLRGGLR